MRTNIKKIFAVLLTVALVATMFVMPAGATVNYGEFLANSVPNGDFAVGKVGMNPYGWGIKSIAANCLFTEDNFAKNFTLTTVLDGDNKVASFKKDGAGYAAIESQPATVVGGNTYYLTHKTKLVAIDFTPVTDCSDCAKAGRASCEFLQHWQGISTIIVQYDKDGNVLDANGAVTTDATYNERLCTNSREDAILTGITDDYVTSTYKFTAHANAVSVRVYVGMGTYGNHAQPTVYIDDIAITDNINYGSTIENFSAKDAVNYELFNGDFEHVIYSADGARTDKNAGPAGWYSIGANQGGSGLITTHSNAGALTYQVITNTEVDANGKQNSYAVFSLKHSYMRSSENNSKYEDTLRGTNTVDTKYYNTIHSALMKPPVAAGKTFTVSYKLKTMTADGSDTIVHGTQATPAFQVWFLDSTGAQIAAATGRFQNSIAIDPADWATFTKEVTVPSNAAYFYIGIHQAVARPQGRLEDATGKPCVNALYCIDDITFSCDTPELSETEVYEKYGIEEQPTSNNGYYREGSNYHNSFKTVFVNDPVYGKIDMITGSDSALSDVYKRCEGYVTTWMGHKTAVTAGDTIKIAYDSKIEGYAEGIAFQKEQNRPANNKVDDPTWALGESPRVAVRYYDADGNVIYATTAGVILTASGAVARVASVGNTDRDWKHTEGTVVVPAGAVAVEYGYFVYGYNRTGTALVKHYFKDVVIASSTSDYWTSDEYAFITGTEKYETNLFDKVLLADGNANAADDVDLADLVNMNNKLTEGTYSAAADMNKNGKIDAEDITLLRWKLLGITDESKAVK